MGVPFCSEGRSPSDSSPGSGPLREGPQEAAARAAPVPPATPSTRASLAAPKPRIDAGPRVSQACVTAPRRQGGLSQAREQRARRAPPSSFRSAEPA